MEQVLADQAVERAKALGFPTFSAYVVQLIRQDLVNRGVITLQEMPGAQIQAPQQTIPPPSRVIYPAAEKPRTKKKP